MLNWYELFLPFMPVGQKIAHFETKGEGHVESGCDWAGQDSGHACANGYENGCENVKQRMRTFNLLSDATDLLRLQLNLLTLSEFILI